MRAQAAPAKKAAPASRGKAKAPPALKVVAGSRRKAEAASAKKPAGSRAKNDPAPELKAVDEAEPAPAPKSAKRREKGVTAEEMGARQREISVSEFFTKNRHLLGFDSPRKALLTCVKEAVDNALDACEEGGILPDVTVKLEVVAEGKEAPPPSQATRFRVTVTDNGPGIVRTQIPKIFAKLLYGSKFHRLRQSRGQQGIGISAAGMYGQLTTGKPVQIISRTSPKTTAHFFEVQIDTKKNEPLVHENKKIDWDQPRGTQVMLEVEGKYQKGRASVDEYLEQIAIANPHVTLTYHTVEGETKGFQRTVQELPDEPREIKPHPYGIEFGMMLRMLQDTKSHSLAGFLAADFSRVSSELAKEICKSAKVSPNAKPREVIGDEAEAVYKTLQATKIMAPPTNCLSPIGEKAILSGLYNQIKGEFYTAVSRPPRSIAGIPSRSRPGWPSAAARSKRTSRTTRRRRRRRRGSAAARRRRGRRGFGRAGAGDPLREPRAAALSTVGVRHVQGRRRHDVEELWNQPVARGAPAGPDGDLRPHGIGVGALHQRVQGSDRRLRRDPQGDHARVAGVRTPPRRVHQAAWPRRERVPAAQHLRAVHRGGRGRLQSPEGRQAPGGEDQAAAAEDRDVQDRRPQDRRAAGQDRRRARGAPRLDHRDARGRRGRDRGGGARGGRGGSRAARKEGKAAKIAKAPEAEPAESPEAEPEEAEVAPAKVAKKKGKTASQPKAAKKMLKTKAHAQTELELGAAEAPAEDEAAAPAPAADETAAKARKPRTSARAEAAKKAGRKKESS
jgi:DNA topoisomerase VI B subunit